MYPITSGVLPSGLSLSTVGVISGTPAPGTIGNYPITVTATDTSTPPITGTVNFTVTIGLNVTSSIPTAGDSVAHTGGTGLHSGYRGKRRLYLFHRERHAAHRPVVQHQHRRRDRRAHGTSTATVVFKAVDSKVCTATSP